MSARDDVLALKARVAESIVGQEQIVERLLLGLLANGHLLVEGLPGLAKTRAIKTRPPEEAAPPLNRSARTEDPGISP